MLKSRLLDYFIVFNSAGGSSISALVVGSVVNAVFSTSGNLATGAAKTIC